MLSTDPYAALPAVPEFTLTSDTLADGERMPLPQISAMLGTGGGDRTPQLSWSGAPAGTRSFALTCFDPDAPTASGFWHLAAYNLSPELTSLPEGAIMLDSVAPEYASAFSLLRNDGGVRGYMGSAPPEGHGDHRYMFVVHALDVDALELDELASPAFLGFNMFGHTLGRARLTGIFGH
ncbi:YbhB/YbcL family Raf kinase inhibitor-like protein [Leucobacter chromiireducens]|uniref:YbhB/YbcL family Raf kinase inhibitor-like protein n=1 Tax=Leucobacter chromiireducens TaxID=283877 RepID=UPI003B20BD2D